MKIPKKFLVFSLSLISITGMGLYRIPEAIADPSPMSTPPFYNVVDIGTNMDINDINNNNEVVGYTNPTDGSSPEEAFVYDYNSKNTVILPPLFANGNNQAYAINNNGDIVAYDPGDENNPGEGVLYKASNLDAPIQLGRYFAPTDINNSDEITGGQTEGDIKAEIWVNGSLITLQGGTNVFNAYSVNNEGNVAGYTSTAALWQDYASVPTIIDSQPGSISTEINDLGQAIVSHASQNAIWQNGVETPIPLDLQTDGGSHPHQMNDEGQILGWDPQTFHESLWQNGTVYDLTKALSNESIEINTVVGINDNGVIAMNGIEGNSEHAFLLIPAKDPCPGDFPSECILATNAAYGLSEGTFTPPAGMKILEQSDKSKRADGFASVALEDGNGYVIIANEGTVPGTSQYNRNSLWADTKIYNDQTSPIIPALSDAINFAQEVVTDYAGKSGIQGIYVTGHSLGGAEAEAQANALPNSITGGVTFGAPGLPGNITPSNNLTVFNYIDYGDPIGNYASDGESALNQETPGLMYHYGQIVRVGSPNSISKLTQAVKSRESIMDLLPIGSITKNVEADAKADYLNMSAYLTVASNLSLHLMDNYAADFGITNFAPLDQVSPSELALLYNQQMGTLGVKNMQSATVDSNGTIDTTDMDFSYSKNQGITLATLQSIKTAWGTLQGGLTSKVDISPTGQVLSQRYIDPEGSIFTANFNDAGNAETISVNPSTGGSYLITYDTDSSQSWNDVTNYYTGKNKNGTLTKTVYNWVNGESQVQIFTGLPFGYTALWKNYDGMNGTGTLTSEQYQE